MSDARIPSDGQDDAGGGAADSDVLDLGGGQPVYLVAVVTTAITSTDADSVTITLRSHEDEDLETGGTPKDHLSVTFAVNTTSAGLATAGSVLFKTALPVDESYQRYIGIYGDIAGSEDVDAGAINAFLTRDPAAWRPLKDAVQ